MMVIFYECLRYSVVVAHYFLRNGAYPRRRERRKVREGGGKLGRRILFTLICYLLLFAANVGLPKGNSCQDVAHAFGTS